MHHIVGVVGVVVDHIYVIISAVVIVVGVNKYGHTTQTNYINKQHTRCIQTSTLIVFVTSDSTCDITVLCCVVYIKLSY